MLYAIIALASIFGVATLFAILKNIELHEKIENLNKNNNEMQKTMKMMEFKAADMRKEIEEKEEELFLYKKNTIEIETWNDKMGFVPVCAKKQRKIRKSDELKEVMKSKQPLYVRKNEDGSFSSEFNCVDCTREEEAYIKKCLESGFPAIRETGEDGKYMQHFYIPSMEDKEFSKYMESIRKRGPTEIIYEKENNKIRGLFFHKVS